MTSLTDRYVAATLRSIPASQREDIERELRASIADALEDQSETEALAALGDPSRLAASYADRPLQLIGPAVYLDYRRVLTILLSSVVPLIFVASGVGAFASSPALSAALATAASTALLVAMHLVIWTTLVFVVIDRTFSRIGRRAGAWSPATLPDLPANRIDLGSIIGGSVMTTVIAAILIVMQATGPGLISPPLWDSGALLLVIVFAAAAIAFDVIGYYVGWGIPQALSNAALSVFFVSTVVGVARGGELLNPAFFEAVGWSAGADVVTWIIIVVIVLLSITNVATGFTCARRSRVSA